MLTRRDLLRNTLLATVTTAVSPRFLLALDDLGAAAERAPNRPYLAAAREAAAWIATSRIPTEHGVTWPWNPGDPKHEVVTDLYTGTPGVIAFHVELYGATGDRGYLTEAMRGADELIATIDATPSDKRGAGLYEGLGGHLYVLAQVADASGDRRYHDAAIRYLDSIRDSATPVGNGIDWGGGYDVISGSAGAGLTLLWAHRALGYADALPLAIKAGRRLMEVGIPVDAGTKWMMSGDYDVEMPNFSHGTAGVAYFLASLSHATNDRAFLTPALSGAKYLQSIADTVDGGWLVRHDSKPENRHLYYMSWCHGPVGTARLFYRLGQITRESSWTEWVRGAAGALMASGIPDKLTPGFWNNVSCCCGCMGVSQFFVDMHRTYGDTQYLAFSRHVADNALGRATADGKTEKWIQAEHRVKPDLLIAQTGFMQGAAGIGTHLLHLDALGQRTRPRITFPDSPFVA